MPVNMTPSTLSSPSRQALHVPERRVMEYESVRWMKDGCTCLSVIEAIRRDVEISATSSGVAALFGIVLVRGTFRSRLL
jgi:hypothetical protein